MINNGHKKTECGFADEIVAYIYDEIDASKRTKFESHLANCTVCTDEFAGISNARFSVFEWQRDEFAGLTTPDIVIPYPPRSEVERAGLFAGIRDLLTLSGWSSAVAIAGTVLVCIGIGFVAMNYIGSDPQIASNSVTVDEKIVRTDPVTQNVPNTVVTTTSTASKPLNTREIRPVRASIVDHRLKEKNLTADVQSNNNDQINKNAVPPVRKAPVLSSYNDDDDKSLRIADLVDDGGA